MFKSNFFTILYLLEIPIEDLPWEFFRYLVEKICRENRRLYGYYEKTTQLGGCELCQMVVIFFNTELSLGYIFTNHIWITSRQGGDRHTSRFRSSTFESARFGSLSCLRPLIQPLTSV